jgi:hypothetical protein
MKEYILGFFDKFQINKKKRHSFTDFMRHAVSSDRMFLYFQDFAIFPIFIYLKFPILHPKILYFSKTQDQN